MKFSTILGTFALSALEANRALASPLEPVSLGAQSLEERNTEYCCYQISSSQGVQNKFVPYTGGTVQVASFGTCQVSLSQGNSPRPSQGGCNKYLVELLTCPSSLNVKVAPAPAVNCQH
ncbi:hypothetical protein E4U30_000358 [Claviceps sp. LM220 group G6]|nr:hypothetical protein E4U15_003207 [Claviceps sp. LM218 group G6]KAG6097707.1 hypothetical protein E4U30_000358 [Claviceps sp. LM220 group G6]KAG6105414.1 hypothetical protein E4U31_001447 [Claviceps sp. LM219 group G6]KAG6115791.1 hypothetical protein E4U14_000670 [Claviceps sp. LM454 group G7]